jgi:hypothetical protein
MFSRWRRQVAAKVQKRLERERKRKSRGKNETDYTDDKFTTVNNKCNPD